MTKKLWGGRFKKGLSDSAIKLSHSVHIDKRLVQYDIRVNQAHANALTKVGVFTTEDNQQVQDYLTQLAIDFQDNLIKNDEDIHSCIERLVTEALGDLGKRLHTGKSRNDQVITDSRLFIKDQCKTIQALLAQLNQTLLKLADRHIDVIIPGFTHFQPAQPVLFSHHLLAYVEKFSRDLKRFQATFDTADVCPLGSAALAGNNYNLDRDAVAKELGFSAITQNSMDAVSDRDFILEFLAACSFCMIHLSRFCEEIIIWNSPMMGVIQLGDAFTTGSSIMPQKKNPDMAELIRGKSGRVLGHLTSLQHTLKGLPLTYNRDLQEDKDVMFDTTDTIVDSLTCFSEMITTLTLNKAAIQAHLDTGYLTATEFADYLVRKGVPFRDAHEMTGKIVNYAVENNKRLDELSQDEFTQYCNAVDDDVYDAISIDAAIQAKNGVGGTSTAQVTHQIKRLTAE
jgi:argininosuccinate lyase